MSRIFYRGRHRRSAYREVNPFSVFTIQAHEW